jgi:hypothetical protein
MCDPTTGLTYNPATQQCEFVDNGCPADILPPVCGNNKLEAG